MWNALVEFSEALSEDTGGDGPSSPQRCQKHHESARPRHDICCQALLQNLDGLAVGDRIAMHLKEAAAAWNR